MSHYTLVNSQASCTVQTMLDSAGSALYLHVDGIDFPVCLELQEDKLVLLVWEDNKQEEPTDKIDLSVYMKKRT